ncbi:hypothetical protein BV22DRAFT_929622 [Leucogyrophana mollusca]|uniref:Uncharacterized protein n=1 Tax=Leucogyrophana mollusca TaxID=85980 RepID=A0ACB8AXQ5_9AGAM|nr:hypothetical protein BV22DRAFT_929622 [Leucogyrophana mollusca]
MRQEHRHTPQPPLLPPPPNALIPPLNVTPPAPRVPCAHAKNPTASPARSRSPASTLSHLCAGAVESRMRGEVALERGVIFPPPTPLAPLPPFPAPPARPTNAAALPYSAVHSRWSFARSAGEGVVSGGDRPGARRASAVD